MCIRKCNAIGPKVLVETDDLVGVAQQCRMVNDAVEAIAPIAAEQRSYLGFRSRQHVRLDVNLPAAWGRSFNDTQLHLMESCLKNHPSLSGPGMVFHTVTVHRS